MYLKLLNKEQKELFVGLLINLASIDGKFSQEEKVMIDGYCYEMGFTYDYNKEIATVQEILDKLELISDIREKKIIVFEAVGLAMSDNIFHENERNMINSMVQIFQIDLDFVSKCEEIIGEYIEFQNRMNNLVVG